jgi:hypothetical protein
MHSPTPAAHLDAGCGRSLWQDAMIRQEMAGSAAGRYGMPAILATPGSRAPPGFLDRGAGDRHNVGLGRIRE